MAQTLTFDTSSTAPLHSNLQLHNHDIPTPAADQVLVQFLAAPINPLDLLVLQGKYPVKPQSFHSSQSIPGYDGVAVIRSVGSENTQFAPGQRVLVSRHGVGTWRTYACVKVTDLLKIPDDMGLTAAAILRMGILMAHLMLEDNASKAKPGDWIIMNAATSTVAHFLGQFARMKGLKTLAVVRDRENVQDIKRRLKNHCADCVITEEELEKAENGRKVVLAFDAVFGAQGQKLIQTLTAGGTYISYGFLGGFGSDVSISISQPSIFVKNLFFKGFRLSATLATRSNEEQERLIEWFDNLLKTGQLTMPLVENVRWNGGDDAEKGMTEAIKVAGSGKIGQQKQIILFPG